MAEESDEYGGFGLRGNRQRLLEDHLSLKEFGFLGSDLVKKVKESLQEEKVFGVPEKLIEKDNFTKETRQMLLMPNTFNDTLLPSMRGFMESSSSRFGKPLFASLYSYVSW